MIGLVALIAILRGLDSLAGDHAGLVCVGRSIRTGLRHRRTPYLPDHGGDGGHDPPPGASAVTIRALPVPSPRPRGAPRTICVPYRRRYQTAGAVNCFRDFVGSPRSGSPGSRRWRRSVSRLVAAPDLTAGELGFLAAATTAPLIVSGAVGSVVETIGGRAIPATGQGRWAVRWTTVLLAGLAPVVIVPAVVVAPDSTFRRSSVHRGGNRGERRHCDRCDHLESGSRTGATSSGQFLLGAGSAWPSDWQLCSPPTEPAALESVGLALAASQATALVIFCLALRRPHERACRT